MEITITLRRNTVVAFSRGTKLRYLWAYAILAMHTSERGYVDKDTIHELFIQYGLTAHTTRMRILKKLKDLKLISYRRGDDIVRIASVRKIGGCQSTKEAKKYFKCSHRLGIRFQASDLDTYEKFQVAVVRYIGLTIQEQFRHNRRKQLKSQKGTNDSSINLALGEPVLPPEKMGCSLSQLSEVLGMSVPTVVKLRKQCRTQRVIYYGTTPVPVTKKKMVAAFKSGKISNSFSNGYYSKHSLHPSVKNEESISCPNTEPDTNSYYYNKEYSSIIIDTNKNTHIRFL